MEPVGWDWWISRLRLRGIEFDPGLTDSEVIDAESRFGFRFPPDLRAFLQTVLPRGEHFPDWRSGDNAKLRDWLDRPRQGVVFDVEHNAVWLDEWGPRPSTLLEATRVVERLIAGAPRLIPIYQHRMIPDSPHEPGNPVFSVHQTDIIAYGTNLRDYLTHEFSISEDEQTGCSAPNVARSIAFWDTDRFQAVRWGADGGCVFDNRRGVLPQFRPDLPIGKTCR